MKSELEKALAEAFPFMRRDLSAGEPGSGSPYSAWGLEVGNGWYQLVWDMCSEITEAYRAADRPVDIVVVQAKEKWGKLRFYWRPEGQEIALHAVDGIGGAGLRVQPGFNGVHRRVGEIVSKYEEQSAHICELCGAPGSLRTGLRRVQTLCREHYARMQEHGSQSGRR